MHGTRTAAPLAETPRDSTRNHFHQRSSCMSSLRRSEFVSRRQILRSAALTAAGLAVAACAPPSSGVAQPTSAAKPGAGAAPASGGAAASLSGTISYWHLNSGPVEGFTDAAHRLEAKNPGLKVDIQSLQNDPFKTKL